MGEPGPRPQVRTFLPTARCPVCQRFVEIHPIEPGGSEVWRLEMHDTAGQTLRLEPDRNPPADSVTPTTCTRCDSDSLSLRPGADHIEAECSDCSHRWRTGRLNVG